jgi:hypothetical protein
MNSGSGEANQGEERKSVGPFGCAWSEAASLALAIASSWLLFIFWPLNWLLLEMPCLVHLAFARSKRNLMIALLCSAYPAVFIWGFVNTARDYSDGSLKIGGLEPYEALQRRYRVPTFWRKDGWPFEIVPLAGEGLALETMYLLRGPMRGTYHGPYPDEEEALQLLDREGENISAASLLAHEAEIDGEPLRFTEEAQHRLSVKGQEPELLRAALIERQCLLLAVVNTSSGAGTELLIIDNSDGSLLNVYLFSPQEFDPLH